MNAASQREAEVLLYLYGVLEAGTPIQRDLEHGLVAGLDLDERVFPLEAAGLIAAVSYVPAEQFSEEPLNVLMTDLAALAPLAVRHEEVVRALTVEDWPLIPMAFGTVYRTAEAVEGLLVARAEELRALLESVRGKAEWDVKVFVDRAQLQRAALEMSPALRDLADQAAAAPPGRAYLLRKQMERMEADEVDRLLEDAVNAVFSQLVAISHQTQLEDLPSAALAERQLVAKAAFLVEHAARESFELMLGQLEETYVRMGLTMELSGPWAPYSFVGIPRADG